MQRFEKPPVSRVREIRMHGLKGVLPFRLWTSTSERAGSTNGLRLFEARALSR